MTDPHQELMRDRLCTGVNNNDLRQLLHHYKDDETIVLTFEDQLNRAKACEAAHRTNTLIEQATHTTEQVNFSQSARKPQNVVSHKPVKNHNKPPTCGWCGGQRHSRRACPANDPTVQCQNCGMKGNHYTQVCRQKQATSTSTSEQTTFKRKSSNQAANATNEVQFSSDDDDYVVHAFTTYSVT